MSKKTLLNESQVRQFMKLAKLQPLTPGFVEGLTENTEEDLDERRGTRPAGGYTGHGRSDKTMPGTTAGPMREETDSEEAIEEGGLYRDDDTPEEDVEAAEDDMGDALGDEEAAEDDLDAAGLEPAGDGDEVALSRSEVLAVFEKALEELFPADEVDVVDAEEEPGEEEIEDVEVTDDVEDVEVEDEEELPLQEADEEDIVEQITKRVAARILKSALAKK